MGKLAHQSQSFALIFETPESPPQHRWFSWVFRWADRAIELRQMAADKLDYLIWTAI
jgi:hypothetical protein